TVQEALDEEIVWRLERDHEVHPAAVPGQHLVQSPSLFDGPREAIEEYAPRTAPALVQTGLDDRQQEPVGDQMALLHQPGRFPADLRPPLRLGAEDRAGREVGQVELAVAAGGLR